MRVGPQLVIALWAGLAAPALHADDTVVKVIALRHRPAADLVEILRPLVGSNGGLDALDTRLVVRATPEALARIEAALADLDRPLRSLLITVSQGLRRSSEGESAGVGGAASGGGTTVVVTPPSTSGGATVETRTTRTVVQGAIGAQSQGSESEALQQVRTVEGGPALIHVGRAQPVATVEVVPTPEGPTLVQGTAYVQAGTGFFVRPRLAGDLVTLELWAESTEGMPSGVTSGQRLGSTVVGRLGEWIEVGNALKEAQTNVRTLGGASRQAVVEERSVRLRVDEVR